MAMATDSLSRTSRRCFICTNDLDGSPGNRTASLPRCPLLRLFSQRLTGLRPLLASQIQEAPWGLHPHPQQAPHSPGAELSEELGGHVRAAFILHLQSLRSFPESSQPPDVPPKFPIRRPHTERQTVALHELGLVRGIEED